MSGHVHITVSGPGRCTECSFHVATQGHRESCSDTAPVEPDQPVQPLSFLERVERRYGKRNPSSTRPRTTGDLGDVAQPGMNPKYVAAAIRRELDDLAAATEGHRNATLCRAACAIFEFVKAGHADEAAARAELERIATAIGLDDHEIRATLKHTWNRVGPRNVPAPSASIAPAYTIGAPPS